MRMGPWNRHAIVLAVVLVISGFAATGLAKGGPPDHAASQSEPGQDGPPAEDEGDPGPPSHARDENAQPRSDNAKAGDEPSSDSETEGSQEEADENSETASTEPSATEDSSDTEDSTEATDPEASQQANAEETQASQTEATETRPDDGQASEPDEPPAPSEPDPGLDDEQTSTISEPVDPSTPSMPAETAPTKGSALAPFSSAKAPPAAAETTRAPAVDGDRDGASPGLVAWLGPGTLLGLVGALGLLMRRGAPRMPLDGPAEGATDRQVGSDADDALPRPASPSQVGNEANDAAPRSDSELASPPAGGLTGVLSLGHEALEDRDLEAAAEWFATALDIDSDLQAAHYCLGLCLDELGRLEEAEARLREARQLEETDPMAAYAHASVLARLGSSKDAVELLERLADRAPELAEAWRDDEELADLHDHPRFLALVGDL